MDTVKRRSRDELGDLIYLRRSAGGQKHCRSHSRTECKPGHDATSRFVMAMSIRARVRFGKRNLSQRSGLGATKLTCAKACGVNAWTDIWGVSKKLHGRPVW